MYNNIELLKQMLSATVKCRNVAKNINCVDDIKKTLVYENLVSNLLLIKDIEAKMTPEAKKKYGIINWEKFDKYDSKIINIYNSLDNESIYKIIKEELPILQEKLEKIIFSK